MIHWKANSKIYNFMFCMRANSASLIKKLAVEIRPKTEESWVLSWMCRTENEEKLKGEPRGEPKLCEGIQGFKFQDIE